MAGDCRPAFGEKDDIWFARRVAGGTCEAVRRSVSVVFCRPSEFTFCARGLPGCAGTVMPLRRNRDAVAPEPRCRCAGTATPFYWNGRAMRKGCGCLAPFPAFGPPHEGRPPIFAKVDPPPSRRSTPFVHGEGGRGSARGADGPRRAFGSCSIYKE